MEWEESCFFQLNTPTFHGGLTHFKSRLNQSVVAIATVKEVYFAKISRWCVLFFFWNDTRNLFFPLSVQETIFI